MRNIKTLINNILTNYNILFSIVEISKNEYTGVEETTTVIEEDIRAIRYSVDHEKLNSGLSNIHLDTLVLLIKENDNIDKDSILRIHGENYRIDNIEYKKQFQGVILYVNRI